jgi:hypothetical protein
MNEVDDDCGKQYVPDGPTSCGPILASAAGELGVEAVNKELERRLYGALQAEAAQAIYAGSIKSAFERAKQEMTSLRRKNARLDGAVKFFLTAANEETKKEYDRKMSKREFDAKEL